MEMKFCQSCGMPLTSDEVCGTNADGSLSADYCTYCYQQGKFAQDCTMDEMIEHCAQFVEEFNKDSEQKVTKEEAIAMMKQEFPKLKRYIILAFQAIIPTGYCIVTQCKDPCCFINAQQSTPTIS